MGLWDRLYKNPRAQEKIRPLLESRMMRDIILEIGQRGSERLDPQSVPLDQRDRASQLAAGGGMAELKQSAIDEIQLSAKGITLLVDGEPTVFLYADYNYEDIEDTDCLPAVAQHLVQHLRGYYNITATHVKITKPNGHTAEKTDTVYIRRHHEDSPFDPGPLPKQKLF